MSKFSASYIIDDGYVGHRPHSFKVDSADIEDDMTAEDLKRFYSEAIEDHFSQHIFLIAQKEEEFVEWAMEEIAARDKEA